MRFFFLVGVLTKIGAQFLKVCINLIIEYDKFKPKIIIGFALEI